MSGNRSSPRRASITRQGSFQAQPIDGNAFEQAIGKLPEVVQCATVTGAADYELRIVTRDMHAFDNFLRDQILSLGLVSNIESRIVIRSVKNTTAAPLGLVSPYVSAQG